MNHYDPAETLTGEEEARFASLPRTLDDDAVAEERTVAALRQHRLLNNSRSPRVRKPLMIFTAIAAALLLFVSVDGYGRIRSVFAQRPDTIVRMAGPPRYSGTATLVEELNIGVLAGADEYTFGLVYDITVGKDGTIYVYDRSIGAIRSYNSAGKYLATFARRGEGPGENLSSGGMGVLPNGQIALYDSQLKRVNIYSATGENISQVRLAADGGTIGHRRGLFVDTSGFVYVQKYVYSTTRTIPTPGGGLAPDRIETWLRIRARDGAIVDTIFAPEWPMPAEPFLARSGRGWRQMAMPFLRKTVARISPMGYLVTGKSDRYAFELIVSPRRVISVRRDLPAPAVSAAEHAAVRKGIETGMREVDPGWSWNGRDVPWIKPYYLDMDIGQDGRIWITREVTPLAQPRAPSLGRTGGAASAGPVSGEPFVAKPTLYDVFEADGKFIGALQAPPMVTIMVTRGDYAWGTFRDDSNVEYVKRYRIVWK